MTRVSNQDASSQKGGMPPVKEQSVVLPDLQIKSPITKGHATDDSFMSAGMKSVASSRNSKKSRFFT